MQTGGPRACLVKRRGPRILVAKPDLDGMNTLTGRTISHYRMVQQLGGGGMGIVYKAEDVLLGRPVAVKFLSPELTRDHEATQRFVGEARAASAISHPSICTIHEIEDSDEAGLFIVMAYYEGGSLKDLLREGPLSVPEALRIATQTLSGLAVAHQAGIVHRDIKPGNIMLGPDRRVKIVDFGLAKLSGESRLTRSGTAVGTVAYMPPEQARGEPVDHRADIWAMGIVLFEMLTGRLPFSGMAEQFIAHDILSTRPLDLGELRRTCPRSLIPVVAKALEKKPGSRYAGACEMLRDLSRVTARLDSRTPAARPGRPRRTVVLPAALLLTICVLTTAFLWARRSIPAAAPALAVLEFRAIGGGSDTQSLAAALTRSLQGDLRAADGLRVVSPAAVSGGTEPMPDLAHSLGVRYVLDGSVLGETGAEWVSVRLFDGPRDLCLWSARFDGSADIQRIPQEIESAVLDKTSRKR